MGVRSWIAKLFRPRQQGTVRKAPLRPSLETLEDRVVPAISVNVVGSELVVNHVGGVSGNNVRVEQVTSGGISVLRVTDHGAQVAAVSPAAVSSIRYTGSTFNDIFHNLTNRPALMIGNAGNDWLLGGSGNDTLIGGAGADGLDGGSGGFDTVRESSNSHSFTLQTVAALGDRLTTKALVNGTVGPAVVDDLSYIENVELTGGSFENSFDTRGYVRKATLIGLGGNDTFNLGSGQEIVYGGEGTDRIFVNAQGYLQYVALADGGDRFASAGNGFLDSIYDTEKVFINGSSLADQIDLKGYNGTADIRGNQGNDIMRGGNGFDAIYGNEGIDIVLASPGGDVVLAEQSIEAAGGVLDRTLTHAELRATGAMTAIRRLARLDEAGGTHVLEIAGPSGAGFGLIGNWTSSTVNGREIFTATGTVILQSAAGDIPIPLLAPLTVETNADSFADFGIVADVTDILGRVSKAVSFNGNVGLNSNDTGSPLHGLLSQYGLSFSTPNASWGLALGSQLAHLKAPLNDAIPYLYFNVQSGYTASFGGVNGAINSQSMTVVFDPSDPFIYLATSAPVPFKVGVSEQGRIPYTPLQDLDFAPSVHGHVIAGGAIDLGAVPVTLGGEILLDLDANDDGILVGLTADRISELFQGQRKLDNIGVGIGFPDVAIGVNGTAGIGYEKAGFSVSVNTVEASAILLENQFHFHANSVEPFEDTPLHFLRLGGQEFEGFIDTATEDFDGTFTVRNGGLFANLVEGEATIHLNNDGVDMRTTVNVLGLGTVAVKGDLEFDGTFSLTGSANMGMNLSLPAIPVLLPNGLDLGYATLRGDVTINNSGFSAGLTSNFSLGDPALANVQGTFTGNMGLSGDRFVAAGGLTASASLLGLNLGQTSVGWNLTNDEVFVDFLGDMDLRFTFNTPSQFLERTITSEAQVGQLVTLSGRITEVNPMDEFILDVDWGDGTTNSYTFAEGSDGLLVSLTHRYAEAGPNGQPYTVTATWRDPAGGGNSAQLSVLVPETTVQQQAANLEDTVNALGADGVLTKSQVNKLNAKLKLDGNGNHAQNVLGFIDLVTALLADGTLSQSQADALLEPGNILYRSLTRRR